MQAPYLALRIIFTLCLLLPSPLLTHADPTKPSPKEFLVASGLTKEAIAAITQLLQQNKIPFTAEPLVGQGENFIITGQPEANHAFSLVKSLQPKFPKNDLVLPDKLVGRTLLDFCAIGLTYNVKASFLVDRLGPPGDAPEIFAEGDGVAGYSIECKRELTAKYLPLLQALVQKHPELKIKAFTHPYSLYQYDEAVPSVNVILH